ncbi:MAG: PAS domain S-box protein [Candidatus Omnitrophica bacterium]|nr:PAS domain S-box protein [Candidatus Omnitrophota bacterium]
MKYSSLSKEQLLAELDKKHQEIDSLKYQNTVIERQYGEIVENAKCCIAVYEAQDEGRSFIIKEFNRYAQEVENVKRKDIIGRNVLDIFPGVEKFGLLDVFRRVLETGKDEIFPVSLYIDQRISGWRENHVYRLSSGDIISFYSDLTREKSIEYAYETTGRKYKLFFDNAPIVIFETDENGFIVDCNNLFEKLLGYSRDESVGRKSADFISDKDKLKFMEMQKEIISGKLTLKRNLHVLTKDKKENLLSITSGAFEVSRKNGLRLIHFICQTCGNDDVACL